MNGIARIYRDELLRAAFGSADSELKVHDIERFNRFAEHLAMCEEAQSIIRAKGHGTAGMTFVELARDVPDSPLGRIKNLYALKPAMRNSCLAETNGTRSAR